VKEDETRELRSRKRSRERRREAGVRKESGKMCTSRKGRRGRRRKLKNE
jgi:hypothetical protein